MTRAARARRFAGARRSCLVGWLVGLALFVSGGLCVANAQPTPRVAAIDWGQAQTLIAIGAPPVAMAQIASYGDWVGGPAVPDSVRELGLRVQPNMELLSQLDLDAITITPMYANSRTRLAQVASVESIDVYYHEGSAWDNTVESTRKLARLVHREAAAEQLIETTRADIEASARRLPADPEPLLVIQFIDARHVRVFGDNSLIGNVMTRMGVANAWQEQTNFWGFALVPIERLAAIENARMAVLDPMPVGVAEEIASSVLWQSLPAVRDRPILDLPAVWSFGGLPSATRFARGLAAAYDGRETADETQTPESAP